MTAIELQRDEDPAGEPVVTFQEQRTTLNQPEHAGVNTEQSSAGDVERRDPSSLSPEDVIIAVMGVTGAGKSTFISQLTKEDVTVGHDLEASTSEPQVFSYRHNGRTIWLIDTPGFDDTYRSDTEILREIAFFLGSIYKRGVKLAGIIYLHRITDVRMTGSSYRNLSLLEKLCGEGALSKVVLATTMWDLLDMPGSDQTTEVGEQREAMLREKFWRNLEQHGALVARHMGDGQSGEKIISHLLRNEGGIVLTIQQEIIDQGLELDKTSAGKFINSNRIKQREKFERELAEAQEALEEAIKEKDKTMIAYLTEQKKDVKAKIDKSDAEQAGLQTDYKKLAHEMDKQYADLAAQMEAAEQAREQEMRYIERDLIQLQETMAKQERQHKDEMRRLTRSQNAKSAAESQRIARMAEEYEQNHRIMLDQIARMEDEKRRKSDNIANRVGGFFKWFFLGSDTPSHSQYAPAPRHGYHNGRSQRHRDERYYYDD